MAAAKKSAANTNSKNSLIDIAADLIGGSGICGIVVYFVKRFIEKKLCHNLMKYPF